MVVIKSDMISCCKNEITLKKKRVERPGLKLNNIIYFDKVQEKKDKKLKILGTQFYFSQVSNHSSLFPISCLFIG